MAREDKPEGRQDNKPARRRYEPPRVIYREPLEAVAVSCSSPGKAGPQELCDFSSS